MSPVILAVIVVTVIGLVGALILVTASVLLHVPTDERTEQVSAALAGANCGACGFAGCSDYARAIVEDGAPIDRCTPGGAACAAAVASIMGVEAAGTAEPMKAVVRCAADCEQSARRFEYQGVSSCLAVKGLYGGDGACRFGCLGYGDCAAACPFDAIRFEKGTAVVEQERCVGCGVCVETCPNKLVTLVPAHKRKPVVLCRNTDKGAQTRAVCTAGCIGCMKCVKTCPKEAITVENNLANIDRSKCVGCGLCIGECPVGVIRVPQ